MRAAALSGLSSKPRFACRTTRAPQARRCRTPLICLAADKMNVMVVGGGGREHALAWKLAQSDKCDTLFCAPGNPGIDAEDKVEGVPQLDLGDHKAVAEFCRDNNVELIAVGPEAPLVDGLVDSLEADGFNVFGPSKVAAQLEGSKSFMKDICRKYNIPTAAYEKFTDPDAAKAYVREVGPRIVVKASGLAAGKGVLLCSTFEEADAAIESVMVERVFGDAGDEVVVEEFLEGEEASFFALIDGESVVAFGSAQDHKAVGEGDTGPNTGGMGAYSPAPVVTPEIEAVVMRDIVQATASAMVSEGCPFKGVLFAGLMIKDGAVKLLEHNVRFGDPECQGLLMRLQSDLLEIMDGACRGRLDGVEVRLSDETVMTVVLAADGYPGAYEKGTVIGGLDAVTGAKVFHAGTARDAAGNVVATGGRVLGVTALGADIKEAAANAYAAVDAIDWPQGFCRRDIGWRAIARLEAARSDPLEAYCEDNPETDECRVYED